MHVNISIYAAVYSIYAVCSSVYASHYLHICRFYSIYAAFYSEYASDYLHICSVLFRICNWLSPYMQRSIPYMQRATPYMQVTISIYAAFYSIYAIDYLHICSVLLRGGNFHLKKVGNKPPGHNVTPCPGDGINCKVIPRRDCALCRLLLEIRDQTTFPSTIPTMVPTVTRNPRIQGLPPITSGLTVILSIALHPGEAPANPSFPRPPWQHSLMNQTPTSGNKLRG